MMFGTIVKRELLDYLQSLRFSISLILCFVMMMASIYLIVEKEAEHNEAIDGVTVGGWLSVSLSRLMRWGPAVHRHNPTLRVLCSGIGEEMAIAASIPVHDQPQYAQGGPFLHNPAPILFPLFDFCFIVVVVTSLIAVIFTYDSIVGEKQKGTLKLVLANSIPRHHVLSAKWLGSFLSFLIGYVPGLLVVLIYMELHPAVLLSKADYVSIIIIDVLSILYVACFFSLGLLASCRCSDTRTSLLTLLTLWALLVLVVPGFSGYLGAVLSPTPAPYEIEKQIQLIQREENVKASQKIRSYENSLDSTTAQDHPERLRAYRNQIMREEIQAAYGRVSRIRDSYTQKLHEQIRFSQAMSCISPLSSFVYLASDLCYTGIHSNWHFRRSADSYQGEFISYVHNRLQKDDPDDPPNLDALPQFTYRERNIPEIIQSNWVHVVFLVLYSTLFFLAAYLSFLKYDVR